MNISARITEALSAFSLLTEHEDGISITTQCIYPTGEFVRVRVYGEGGTFIVSDEGGALRQLSSAGAEITTPDRLFTNIVKKLGVKSVNGILRTHQIDWAHVPLAIAALANASKQVADDLFGRFRLDQERDLKILLRQLLEVSFPANVHKDRIVGVSNRAHEFDSIITFERKRVIVDPVLHDPSAINARVVANIDVQKANIPLLEQRIVYDDEAPWTAAELNLLQLGAPLVPYSRLPAVLPSFARH